MSYSWVFALVLLAGLSGLILVAFGLPSAVKLVRHLSYPVLTVRCTARQLHGRLWAAKSDTVVAAAKRGLIARAGHHGNGGNCSRGRSRHGIPVRYRYAMPSTTRRWSPKG
ncbi:hypothetical protein GCM10023081_07620 [Arthrobacter ginkgonis]|uniref:Uncharacterized protein n=1 Tax=Arthrobacter ginkgonis TaxID=1630594 RepID=A0ABP7BWM3_9MICC